MKQFYPNPFIEQRADPFICHHQDGVYYFTASVPEYDRIEIRRAKTLADLRTAAPFIAWKKHAQGKMSALIWAPELHFLKGKWYIYFAAASSTQVTGNTFNHRMYVLENASSDPCTPNWVEKGQMQTGWDSFALDATVMAQQEKLYYIWAQQDEQLNPKSHSNIYIAEMKTPWQLNTPAILLSQPEFPWETTVFHVNEGPAILKKDGKIFLTYSASATDENYCIGMLSASTDADLLNPLSWKKSSVPVFQTSYEHHIYGPGHNSFTTAEDGITNILVYHARNYTKITGDPLYDPNRHTRLQAVNWNADGTPDFGSPLPEI